MTSNGKPPRSQLELLREYGVKPTKKRGQNFLVDGNLARAITADILALGNDVLELGAGGGALTRPLLEAGARVRAIEVDRGLCAILEEELGGRDGLTLQEGDIARLDWDHELEATGERPVMAGNLPYVLTSEVLFALADHRNYVAGGVFMVQKEVAQRLVAGPGGKEYGVLAVILGSLFDCDLVRTVPANVFWPRPAVTSAIVRLIPKKESWDDQEFVAFKGLVKFLFNHRRKQLHRLLRTRLGDADTAHEVLRGAAIKPSDRPEQVDRERLRILAQHVRKLEES